MKKTSNAQRPTSNFKKAAEEASKRMHADATRRVKRRGNLTISQLLILCDANRDGMAVVGGELTAARSLQRKGFGKVEDMGRYHNFVINDLGRAILTNP